MIKLAVRYVKKEEEQALRQWLSELNRRRDEVIETFAQEGTRQEQAYVSEIAGRTVLIYVTDARDHEQAAKPGEPVTRLVCAVFSVALLSYRPASAIDEPYNASLDAWRQKNYREAAKQWSQAVLTGDVYAMNNANR